MRKVQPKQLQLGEIDIDIASIELDTRSRDDIPQILLGLQCLYTNIKTRELIFSLLEELIPQNVSSINGRPGIHLCKILILGVLRLNLNWDQEPGSTHQISTIVHYNFREIIGCKVQHL